MKMLYARVSSKDQNLERQLERAKKEGNCRVYTDKASGKNTDRPGLKAMLDNIREGDTVAVLSIDRLGRNLKDIINIVDEIKSQGCIFECLSPRFDTTTPFGDFFLAILASIAEMERKQILERQMQGIEIAKRLGRYTGRKPKSLEGFNGIYKQWLDNKITSEQAGKLLGVSRSTFYRRVKQYQENEIIDLSEPNESDNVTK